jgi:hypothetical protein
MLAMLYGQWRENMATHELQLSEPQSSNGWQNIGICYTFAIDAVPFKLQSLYMHLVRHSFGYMQMYTPRWTQLEWSNKIGIARTTFTDQVHKLSELGLISINASHKYIEDGGSEAFSYSPAFPKGYGQLKFKDDKQLHCGSDKTTTQIYNPNSDI